MKDVLEGIAHGKYYWEPLFDWNNSDNAGALTKTYETTCNKSVNSKEFLLRTFHIDVRYKFENEVSATLTFEGAGEGSASLEHRLHIDTANELQETSETGKMISEEMKRTETYEVGPHSRLQMYRLCYSTAGVIVKTDITSTQPAADIIVPLKFKCERRILGLAEILDKFSSTYPAISNVGEWRDIRDAIIVNSTRPALHQLEGFIKALSRTRPGHDNIAEWESIKATCDEIGWMWGDNDSWGHGESDKQLLFNKLLRCFETIRPARGNRNEWSEIRELSNRILRSQKPI